MPFHIEGTFSDSGKTFFVENKSRKGEKLALEIVTSNCVIRFFSRLFGHQLDLKVYDANAGKEEVIAVPAKQARELLGMGEAEKHQTYYMGIGRSLAAMLHSMSQAPGSVVHLQGGRAEPPHSLDSLYQKLCFKKPVFLSEEDVSRLKLFGFRLPPDRRESGQFWKELLSLNQTSWVHAPKDITPQESLFLREFRQRRNNAFVEPDRQEGAAPQPPAQPSVEKREEPPSVSPAPTAAPPSGPPRSFLEEIEGKPPTEVRVLDPAQVTVRLEEEEIEALQKNLCTPRMISGLLLPRDGPMARMRSVGEHTFALTECQCHAATRRDLGIPACASRNMLVTQTVREVEKQFPPGSSAKKEIAIFSFAAGGCFQELALHANLVAKGYAVTWHLVDPCLVQEPREGEFGSRKAAEDFANLVGNINEHAGRENKPVVLWRSFEELFSSLRTRYQQAATPEEEAHIFGDANTVVWLACDCDLHSPQPHETPPQNIMGRPIPPIRMDCPVLFSDARIIEEFPRSLAGETRKGPPIIRSILEKTAAPVQITTL